MFFLEVLQLVEFSIEIRIGMQKKSYYIYIFILAKSDTLQQFKIRENRIRSFVVESDELVTSLVLAPGDNRPI